MMNSKVVSLACTNLHVGDAVGVVKESLRIYHAPTPDATTTTATIIPAIMNLVLIVRI